MYLIDFLKEKSIFLKYDSETKKEKFIQSILENASEKNILPRDKIGQITKLIIDRENQMSTGLGNGIAIPHCKTDLITEGLLIAVTIPSGIKFNAIDGKKVNIVFFIIFPEKENKEYLQVLAKIGRLLKEENLKNKLILSDSETDFREIIGKNDIIPLTQKSEGKYLFVLSINDTNKIKNIYSNLLEIGADTTLIMDTETLQKKLAYDIPIFGGMGFFNKKTPYSKTFFGIINSIEQIDYLNDLLKKEDIDLSKPGVGMLFTTKVEKLIGGMPEEINI